LSFFPFDKIDLPKDINVIEDGGIVSAFLLYLIAPYIRAGL